jgi:hypothetical protein
MTQRRANVKLFLRKITALRFAIAAKLAALFRIHEGVRSSGASTPAGEAPDIAMAPVISKEAFDVPLAEPKPSDISERRQAPLNSPSDREQLIRRRWAETGIKMWNPDVHGKGKAALNIQGKPELLPSTQGRTLPSYDTLEFKLAEGCIVCEGVVIDPPKSRRLVKNIGNGGR